MRIEGNATTCKFIVEQQDEIPILKRFADKFGVYCGSFANEDRSVQGVEVATGKLLELVQNSVGVNTSL